MTTQSVDVWMHGPAGTEPFAATITDGITGSYSEVKHSVATDSSIGDPITKGKRFTHLQCEYDAGILIGRVRNARTGKVKLYFSGQPANKSNPADGKLDTPFSPAEGDILEVMTDVVPT